MNRLDRAEYDRRSEELQRKMDAWQQSGRSAQQTQELFHWLTRSLEGELASPPGVWPVERSPVPSTPIIASPNAPSPIAEGLAPQFSLRSTHDAAGRFQTHREQDIGSAAVPIPQDQTVILRPKPAPTAALTAPRLSATADRIPANNPILNGVRSTIEDLAKRVAQIPAISSIPDSVPPPVMLPQMADVPDAPPFVSPAFVPQAVPKLDISVPKIGGLAEMRRNPRSVGRLHPNASGEEGRVNFTEVAAMTRSYNVSLGELETKLSIDTNWTTDRLEPMIGELEDLARRYSDLELYNKALTREESSQLADRDPLDQAIRLMGKRIAEVRRELTERADGSPKARQISAELDGFSRRLAALAGQK
ncbi:MAG: hypothetical protein IT427_06620 [Pirellulales bacterium]|nr:hypothetical protein [Pirellulales bacterium]